MLVISDTTAITSLAAIGQLGLLHDLYGDIIVPDEVKRELVEAGSNNPGAMEVQTEPWIHTRSVADRPQLVQLLHVMMIWTMARLPRLCWR